MENVTVGGVRLAYARSGKGLPLVLLHGYPLDHSIWDQMLPLLEDRFDLVVPDLRGFGESSSVEAQYSMDEMAKDVAGLLDHLEISKGIVAGHSMGGYVALAFARMFSHRLLALGLVSSQLPADPAAGKDARYKTAAAVAEKGTSAVVEALTPKLSANPDVQEFVRALMGKQPAAGVIGALRAMAERHDSMSLLENFRPPLVVVHGDADALIPIERAREIKAAVPAARLIELPGIGHMPMMEAPQATAGALKDLASGPLSASGAT